ncbi:MAG: glutathione peroxidase [Gemmatimonadetes bacterium]|nr:glutathione peroxidase [Gemmatimonadota bacterium]
MSIYEIPVSTLDGTPTTLERYRGQLLLIVNVASKCGLTPQYTGLEAMHEHLAPRGFSVLGFPCNQFGEQEPGSEKEIETFCSMTYGVTFPMFAKVDVNGPGAHPLWEHLKSERPGLLGTEAIKWNFTKFLVARDGAVLKRFSPTDEPAAIEKEIAPLL